MKILITQDVDGMAAGEIHDLRAGYALALINRNQATDPVASTELPEIEVVVESTPVVETSTESPDIVGGYVELVTEDDDE